MGRATALAVDAGARVLVTARPDDEAACVGDGADAVVDYRDPDLVQRLRELAPDGVDVHLDTAGRHDLDPRHWPWSGQVGGSC